MPRIKGVNESGVPVGTVISSQSAHTAVPFGFLYLDGSVLTKTVYAKLYAKLVGQVVETSTTFTLPDLRGQFLRGLDTTSSALDPDKASRSGGDSTSKLGSTQASAFGIHSHIMGMGNNQGLAVYGTSVVSSSVLDGGIRSGTTIPNTSSTGANETRPKNFATNYFIAYI